jgi:hypothetical protein
MLLVRQGKWSSRASVCSSTLIRCEAPNTSESPNVQNVWRFPNAIRFGIILKLLYKKSINSSAASAILLLVI